MKLLLRTVFLSLIPLLLSAEGARIYFGPAVLYRDYHEELMEPAKSDEHGFLYGFQLGYDREKAKKIYVGASLLSVWGNTNYDGAIQDLKTGAISPYLDTTGNFLLNAEGRLGYGIPLTKRLLLTPFATFGYFLWSRDIDYMEYYQWEYLGGGARLTWEIEKNWSLGLRFTAAQMIGGEIEIVDPERRTTLALGNRPQYLLEVPFTRLFTNWDLSFVPFFQSQRIGESEKADVHYPGFGDFTILEPASRTFVAGARLEIGLRL